MSPFFSFNKLVGGLHLAYFQYVQHPNATPLTAQNIKGKNFHSCKKNALGVKALLLWMSIIPYNFTWTETIYSLRLYKHKIEHNTLGLSRTSVLPLPHLLPLVHFSQVHPFVCWQSFLFSKQEKNPHTRQARATGRSIRLIIQIALKLTDGFEYMKLQGNVHI